MTWVDEHIIQIILILQSIVTAVMLTLAYRSHRAVHKRKRYFTCKRASRASWNIHISDDFAERLVKQLGHFMHDKRPYRNADLKVETLASEMGISAEMLSELIHQKFEHGFKTFVNTYRITEAIRILQNYKRSSMYEVSRNVGFHSVNDFESAFKTHTDTTLKEFLENDMTLMDIGFT